MKYFEETENKEVTQNFISHWMNSTNLMPFSIFFGSKLKKYTQTTYSHEENTPNTLCTTGNNAKGEDFTSLALSGHGDELMTRNVYIFF